MQRAIHLIAAYQQEGRDLCLAVDLSGKAVTDRDLLPLIGRELIATGIDPARLILAITETAAVTDLTDAQGDHLGRPGPLTEMLGSVPNAPSQAA